MPSRPPGERRRVQGHGGSERLGGACFLRPISDHAERYAAISKHLQRTVPRTAPSFSIWPMASGSKVAPSHREMAWIQARYLDRFVEGLLDQPKELAALRREFRTLVKGRRGREVRARATSSTEHPGSGQGPPAHRLRRHVGPCADRRQATEIGHRAYQHAQPQRGRITGPIWTGSPALVTISRSRLEINRKLWTNTIRATNLLFVREDFTEAGRSPIWGDLAALQNPEGLLSSRRAGRDDPRPRRTCALEAVLSSSAGLKPMELKAGAPGAPEKPKWTVKPSKSGSAADPRVANGSRVSRPGEKTETRWKKEVKEGPVEVESEGGSPGPRQRPDWIVVTQH